VVWEGHPGNLKDDTIEEHLRNVRLIPTFELSKELSSAGKYLNAGNYSTGVRKLQSYLKKPKSEDVAKEAREAIEKVNAFGKSRLELVEGYAGEGYYADAMEILADLNRRFKGLETGDKAKEKLSEWRKDKKIKLEVEGAAIIQKASQLSREKKFKASASLLLQILRSKKFEDTKVRELAEKEYRKIESFL